MSAVAFFVDRRLGPGLIAIALVVPCFARYYEHRLRSTTQPYIHVITMYRRRGLSGIETPPPAE